MFKFIFNLWVMRKVDAVWVQEQVLRWISQEQADTILAAPQVAK